MKINPGAKGLNIPLMNYMQVCLYSFDAILFFVFCNRREIEQRLEDERMEQQKSSLYLEEYLKLLEEKVCIFLVHGMINVGRLKLEANLSLKAFQ